MGLVPASSIPSGGAISGVTITGTAAAGDVPVASSSSAGAWQLPPGYEIGYTQITASVNVTSTNQAAGTLILSPGALTFDGGAVMVEFFSFAVTWDTAAVGDVVIVSLFESSTQITELGLVQSVITAQALNVGVEGRYRFTPSAGAHTYTVTAFATSTSGTPKVTAGAGGTGGFPPAFVRFTKV